MSEQKDVVFFVADGTMEAVFQKFLQRQNFETRLGCKTFSFDIARDPSSTDGGLYKRAHELLRPYQATHSKAIVVLDQQFGGELPAAEVQQSITENLHASGWAEDDYAVIVIDPELEVWLWQDNPHIQQTVKYTAEQSLREFLATTGEWPAEQMKPIDPKACIQKLIRSNRAGPPMVVYSTIASRVSSRGCQDESFQQMMATLANWYPV